MVDMVLKYHVSIGILIVSMFIIADKDPVYKRLLQCRINGCLVLAKVPIR